MGLPVYDIPTQDSLRLDVKPVEFTNPFIARPHPHRHTFYEIIYFRTACGTHSIDFEDYTISDNSIFFVPKGAVHMIDLKGSVCGMYVTFNEELVSSILSRDSSLNSFSFFHSYRSAPLLKLNFENSENVQQLISVLHKEFAGCQVSRNSVLPLYLGILLHKLNDLYVKEYPDAESVGQSDLVARFKELLGIEFKGSRFVKDYAKRLCVTPNHLNEVVKSRTGKSAGWWVRDRVLLEAKRLLLHSPLTIQQVSQALYFEDPSYFSRFFKRYEGLSPSEYLQQNSKY